MCAFANNDGQISGTAISATPNTTVEIPIKYSSNPGFWVMFVEINFDPEIFEFAGFENGDYAKTTLNEYTYDNNPGKVLLFLDGQENANLTGDGVIAKLQLHVKETAAVGNYAIDVSEADGKIANFDAELVRPDYFDGSVYVVCSEHNFEDNKCTNCSAVKEGDNVIIDLENAPEPIQPIIKDINNNPESGTVESSSTDSSDSSKTSSTTTGNDSGGTGSSNTTKVILRYLIVVAGGLLVIAVVVLIVVSSKKKK